MDIISFIFKRQPKSYQGSKTFKSGAAKGIYITELKTAVKKFNTIEDLMIEDLYGVVYYFQKKKTGTDADNISKPIWDCLKGVLFIDDKQIKLRIAGLVDISQELAVIDFSGISNEIMLEILDAYETTEHFIYVECGLLNSSMYKFNLYQDGD